MASKNKPIIRGDQWGTIFANVSNRSRTLAEEACRLGTDEATLIEMGDRKFYKSTDWENCKRASSKRTRREQKQFKKTKFTASSSVITLSAKETSLTSTIAPASESNPEDSSESKPSSEPTSEHTSASESIFEPASEHTSESDSISEPTSEHISEFEPTSVPKQELVSAPSTNDIMDELLCKKDELQQQANLLEGNLSTAREILQIRKSALKEAEAVLEKAQASVKQANTNVRLAEKSLEQAENQRLEAQGELFQLERRIQQLKDNLVYLIDPWFTGTLPDYGTFLSTVEMEGVTKQDVSEDYLPEATVDGILLFDFVPDYKKARSFIGLVAKFELEEKPYTLLVSDERVKTLIDKYIGK